MSEMFHVLVVLIVSSPIHYVSGLSPKEASLFYNSGKYGGFVKVSVQSDRIEILTNGIPDHGNYTNMQHEDDKINYEVSLTSFVFGRLLPGCLSWGPIGLTRTGVPFYHPVDTSGRNLFEGDYKLSFDKCNGIYLDDEYRYYGLPTCLYKGEVDELIGVALDGNPIYGPKVSFLDREVTSADLDMCHGKFFNGTYAYFLTSDFPYVMGCYKSISRFNTDTQHICSLTQSSSSLGYICLCSVPDTSDDDDTTESSGDGPTTSTKGPALRPDPINRQTPGVPLTLIPQVLSTVGNKGTTEAVNKPLPPRPFPDISFPGFPVRPLPVGFSTPKPNTILNFSISSNQGDSDTSSSKPSPSSTVLPVGISTPKPNIPDLVISSNQGDNINPNLKPSPSSEGHSEIPLPPMPKPNPGIDSDGQSGLPPPMPKPNPGIDLDGQTGLPPSMPTPSPDLPDKPPVLPNTPLPKPEVFPVPDTMFSSTKKPAVTTRKPTQPPSSSETDNTDILPGGSGWLGTSGSVGSDCKMAVILSCMLLCFISYFAN